MKNKNIILWATIFAVLVGFVALVSANVGNSNSNISKYSGSSITAVENIFDFGTISMKDGNVSHLFEIKNDGIETVQIGKVFTSCMCTTAYVIDKSGKRYGKFGMQGHGLQSKTKIEVSPGESVTIEAIYDPNAHGPSGIGLAERSIYIETNSAKSPKLELSFRAMVTR